MRKSTDIDGKQKSKRGRPEGITERAQVSKYQCVQSNKALFKTMAQVFALFETLEKNGMNKLKTARDLKISRASMNLYYSKYWHEYEAKKKIDIEEAERRARAANDIANEDDSLPQDTTAVEVINENNEKVRLKITNSFMLGMAEINRRLLDPIERRQLNSRDIVTHINNLLPYLAPKVNDTGNDPDSEKSNKDEFVKNFIETMTGYKQKTLENGNNKD